MKLTTATTIVQSSQATFLMIIVRVYIRMARREHPANPIIHAATTRPGPRFTSRGGDAVDGSIVIKD